jgi:Ca2+-dependent lipid-binding protein
VVVKLTEARELTAGDKSGNSDHYAIFELVDQATGKPLQKVRKRRTKTVNKTLAPTWNEEFTWLNVRDTNSVAVEVTVYDAGTSTLSSDVLGGFSVPLSKGTSPEGTGAQWYPLKTVIRMGNHVAVSGSVRMEFRVTPDADAELNAAAAKLQARQRGILGRKTATDKAGAVAAAIDVKERAPHTVAVTLQAARELPARDKNGASDPYAIFELVDTATGKPLKKPCKRKTKTAKKNLAPTWAETVSWLNVLECPSLSLQVTVYDADTLLSRVLGCTRVPLSAGRGPEGTGPQWLPLEATVGKNSTGKKIAAGGWVHVEFSVVPDEKVEQHAAAAKLQARQRGAFGRHAAAAKKAAKPVPLPYKAWAAQRVDSATKIQALLRGKLGAKRAALVAAKALEPSWPDPGAAQRKAKLRAQRARAAAEANMTYAQFATHRGAAATAVQALVRSQLARRRVAQQKQARVLHCAATAVQRLSRGVLGRARSKATQVERARQEVARATAQQQSGAAAKLQTLVRTRARHKPFPAL